MSSNSSVSSPNRIFVCTSFRVNLIMFTAFVTSYVLLLPLFCAMVCVSVQRRRQQRCRPTATGSHSDVFTYNVVGMELVAILGLCLYLLAVYSKDPALLLVGLFLCSGTTSGQILFHLFICVDRYLAVVHPISYLSLKQTRGLRIRNVSTACVWLLCVGLMGLSVIDTDSVSLAVSCLLVFSLILLSFCSCSVLCVLHQAGPGQAGRARTRHRAFHTIAAITVAQWCKFVGNLASALLFKASALSLTDCVVGISVVWLTLPCSLVLPLLFLQRAGKLPGCKANARPATSSAEESSDKRPD